MHALDPFLAQILAVGLLLVAAAVTELFCRKFRFSYLVALILVGAGVGLAAALVPGLDFVRSFSFSPETLFFLFLPTLIFESAFHFRWRIFRQILPTATILAVPGVLISATIVAAALHFAAGIGWAAAGLFGVIVSATDPVATIATSRALGAPRHLSRLIEGESLLNDATTVVFFNILAKIAIGAGAAASFSILGTAGEFFWTVAGGLAVGAGAGFLFSLVLARIANAKFVELTLTIVLAHLSFIAADLLGFSGILATMAAGLVLGGFGRHKISPEVLPTVTIVWDYLAFVANSLLFLLLGLSFFPGVAGTLLAEWPTVLAVLAAVAFSRPVVTAICLPLGNLISKPAAQISLREGAVVTWAGLRGAVAAALVLLLPVEFPHRELFLALVVAVVFGTIIGFGGTAGWVLRALGLTRHTEQEKIEKTESQIFVFQKMRARLARLRRAKKMSPDFAENLEKNYADREKIARENLAKMFRGPDALPEAELEFLIRKHCLGVERRVFLRLFRGGEIAEAVLADLLDSNERQITRLRRGDRQILAEPRTEKDFDPGAREPRRTRRIWRAYEKVRARAVAGAAVRAALAGMAAEGEILTGGLAGIERQYLDFSRAAEGKKRALRKSFPREIAALRDLLARRHYLETKESATRELFEKNMVTEKILREVETAIELEKKKIRRAV